MPTDTSLIARDIFRVLATGDAGLAVRVAGPTFHNREASVSPAASSLPGPAGLLASSAWMRFAFTDLRFPIIDAATTENEVWLRLRMQGTHTGAFVQFQNGKLAQAVPPTGKSIDFEQIHTLTLHDGKVVGHEAVRDDVTMLGQLGIFPPNPATMLRVMSWAVTGRAKRAAREVSQAADRAAAQIRS